MAAYLDQKMYEVRLAASAVSHDYLEELVYIMAAFADETFVCLLEWPGKDYWRDHLMELRLFHSQIAGQDIFRRIEKSLVRQDYGVEELAIIYLMVLALGFKGQYLRDPAAVELYRKKLFDRLVMTNPELRRESQRLFPEAYRHTVTEGAPVRLPEPVNLVADSSGNSRVLVAPFHDRLAAAHHDDAPRTVGHHEVAGSSCQSRDSYLAHG